MNMPSRQAPRPDGLNTLVSLALLTLAIYSFNENSRLIYWIKDILSKDVEPYLQSKYEEQVESYLKTFDIFEGNMTELIDCRNTFGECHVYENELYNSYSNLVDARNLVTLKGDLELEFTEFHSRVNDLHQGFLVEEIDSRRALSLISGLRSSSHRLRESVRSHK